jgi:hypothetical protein
MKLHPPTILVDDKEPFKEALFGRKEFAESMTALLRNVDEKGNGDSVDREWMMNILNYCLFSDAELEAVPDGTGPRRLGQWLMRYDMDRHRVIPFFCRSLDRFSIQPPSM